MRISLLLCVGMFLCGLGQAASDNPPLFGNVEILRKVCGQLSGNPDPKVASGAKELLSLTDTRKWTDVTGKFAVEAHYVQHNRASVTLEKPDSKQVTVPLERLAERDRSAVKRIGDLQTFILEEGGYLFDVLEAEKERARRRALVPADRGEALKEFRELAKELTVDEMEEVQIICMEEAIMNPAYSTSAILDVTASRESKIEILQIMALPALQAIHQEKARRNVRSLSQKEVKRIAYPLIESNRSSLESFFFGERRDAVRGGKTVHEMTITELTKASRLQAKRLSVNEIRCIESSARKVLSSRHGPLRRRLTSEQELELKRSTVGLGDFIIEQKRKEGVREFTQADLQELLDLVVKAQIQE